MKKQIIQGTADAVSCRFEDRPSACTVALYGADGSELAADGATGVTLGAECTVASDSGYSQSDRRQLTLNSTGYSDLSVNEPYRLDNASGQHEWVRFLKLPTDRDAVVSEELEYDYEADDTLVGTWVTRAVTDSESADLGINYRARFAATVGSSTVIKDVLFDVVKSKIEQPLTPDNISEYDPLINRQLPAEIAGTDWSKYLEKVWDLVYQDLINQQLHPSRIMDPDQIAPLHYYKFKMRLAEDGLLSAEELNMYQGQAIKHFAYQYTNHMQMILKQMSWYDADEDLVPDDEETNRVIGYPRFRLG